VPVLTRSQPRFGDEEPEQIASDLIKLMRYSKKIQASAADKQKLFDRICRLDPVQALSVG
jgi:hypothetical protein